MEVFLQSFEIWFSLGLIALGYGVGRYNERRHYASIHEREAKARAVPVVTGRKVSDDQTVASAELAMGSVVIAIDAYKSLLMGIRNFVGGESAAYASLIDRARREAALRMRESRPDADAFVNYRIQTATLFHGRGKSASSIEIIAYATALRFEA